MRRFVFILAVIAISIPGLAQVDRQDVRRGNRDYKKGNYKEAEIDYRKALVKDSTSLAANYNLASVLYRNNDFEAASKSLEAIGESAPSSKYAADYYFNKGDIALAGKDYQKAVDAFKQSLLANPGDLEAKENYIYARKMLENQQNQQNQDGDNGDNQDNKDNNQDNKDNQNQDNQQDNQNQDQDKNRNQDNQQNQEGQQDKPEQQQSQSQPQISPQAAQQMLQAIQDKEKQTQDKVKKEKAAVLKSKQKEKNW